ncbi:MAG: beta-propeller fold lactonase family protein [Nitrospirota bacterium]
MKRTFAIGLLFLAVLSLSACGNSEMAGTDQGMGGITATAVWPGSGASAKSGAVFQKAPAEVAWVRMIVSKGTTTLQADFAAAAGSGSIASVPAGSGWTLTFQGLNSGKTAVYYQGSKDGITVTGGATTNAGSVAMYVEGGMSGLLDTSFDTDGMAVTSFGTSTASQATGLAVQPDGKIVVVANSWWVGGPTSASHIIRYNPDGTLDPGFGSSGIVSVLTGTVIPTTYAIAIQPDGKIIIAGSSGPDSFIARYLPDGRLDNSANDPLGNLAGSGWLAVNHGGGDRYNGLAIASDGTIVATGQAVPGSAWVFSLLRLSTSGSVITSVTATARSSANDYGHAVAISGDGSIFVGGDSWITSESDFALIKFNSSGSKVNQSVLDVGFGKRELGRAIGIQSNGKVLMAGPAGCDSLSKSCFGILRFNADATIDTGFGASGKVLTTFNGTTSAEAYALKVLPDDSFIIFGDVNNGTRWVFGIAKYDSSGNLDVTFNPSGPQPGTLMTAIGTDMPGNCLTCGAVVDQSFGLGIQSDGKIITAAYSVAPASNNNIALARYWNDVTTKGKIYGVGGNQLAVTTTYSSSTATTLYKLYMVQTPSSTAVSLVNAAVDASANRLYTSDNGGGTGNKVYVIDTINNMTLTSITVGTGPGAVLSPQGTHRLYVSNNGNANNGTTVSVIDTSDNTVIATITGLSGPRGLTFDPTGNRLYVVNSASNTVSVVDTLTNTIIPSATLSGFNDPVSAVFDPATSKLFVTNQGANTVSAINMSTGARSEIPVDTGPFRLALDSAAQRLYVTNYNSGVGNTVSAINTSTNVAFDTITVGTGARSVGMDAAAKILYVDCMGDLTGYVIDVASDTNTVISTSAGGGMHMVVVP